MTEEREQSDAETSDEMELYRLDEELQMWVRARRYYMSMGWEDLVQKADVRILEYISKKPEADRASIRAQLRELLR